MSFSWMSRLSIMAVPPREQSHILQHLLALIRDAPEHALSQCERFCTALPKQVSDSIGGYKENK